MHCSRKGHRSEGCWQKFPEKAPGYVDNREDTPGPGKLPKITKKRKDRRSASAGSDRGSDFEASGSEAAPEGEDTSRD